MKTILLWIAVPFAAIAAMFIGNILGKVIQGICLNVVLIGMTDLKVAISTIVGELTAGVCFVAAGTAVAPAKKGVVSIVLATIAVLLSVLSTLYYILIDDLTIMKVIYTLSMSIGAIGYTCQYKDDSIGQTSKRN